MFLLTNVAEGCTLDDCPCYLLILFHILLISFVPFTFFIVPLFFFYILMGPSCNTTVNSSVGSIHNKWELQKYYEHVTIGSGGALALCCKRYATEQSRVNTSLPSSVSFCLIHIYGFLTSSSMICFEILTC